MSTHTPSPPASTPAGSRGPRRRWWPIGLAVAAGVIALGAAGVYFWQQQQQSCSKAADPARSGAITEYCPSEPYLPFSGGGAMTAAPDGNLWYTNSRQKITRFTLPGGAVTEFAAPSSPNSVAYQAMVSGADGSIWYVANYTLGRISMSGDFKEFDLPKDKGFVAAIATGANGALWVTMGDGTLLHGVIPADTTQAPALTPVTLPANAWNGYMAAGPDGSLWMAGTSAFTRVTQAGGITQFPVTIPGPAPSCGEGCKSVTAIAAGPDGNMWFADGWGHIGKITPTGATTFFHVADQLMGPLPLGAGPDGNMWFSTDGNSIERITPAGVATKFALPHTGGHISNIIQGPDGGVWFILGFSQPLQPSSRLVRVTP